MATDRMDFGLFAAPYLRDEKHQDDFLQAFEDYVKNDASTLADVEKALGMKLQDSTNDVKLDVLLCVLDDARLKELKQSLGERSKLPAYQPSKEVASKTYWDSLKTAAIPFFLTTIVAGPIAGVLVGGGTVAIHQGKTQSSHRNQSRERAEELLAAISRVEKVKNPVVVPTEADDDTDDQEQPPAPSPSLSA